MLHLEIEKHFFLCQNLTITVLFNRETAARLLGQSGSPEGHKEVQKCPIENIQESLGGGKICAERLQGAKGGDRCQGEWGEEQRFQSTKESRFRQISEADRKGRFECCENHHLG